MHNLAIDHDIIITEQDLARLLPVLNSSKRSCSGRSASSSAALLPMS
jgi:hypothetical protein